MPAFSRRERAFLALGLVVLLLSLFVVYVQVPLMTRVDSMRAAWQAGQTQLKATEQLAGDPKKAEAALARAREHAAQVAAKLPGTWDQAPILRYLDAAATAYGVRIGGVTFGTARKAQALEVHPVELTVEGTYAQIYNFLRGFQAMPQEHRLEGLKLGGVGNGAAAGATGGGAAAGAAGSAAASRGGRATAAPVLKLQVTVEMLVYPALQIASPVSGLAPLPEAVTPGRDPFGNGR